MRPLPGWEGPLQRSAGRDPFHDLVVVLLDIKAQKPGVLAMLKKRTQRAARFRYAGGRSYMRRNGLLQKTIRELLSNMQGPCDM